MASLKKLQKEWYAKLKESGFKDIEKADGSIGRTQLNLKNRDYHQISAAQEYYSQARSFLHDHAFKNERERYIWEAHSEGDSERKISANLSNVGYISLSRAHIGRIIRKLSRLMKEYYKNQENYD